MTQNTLGDLNNHLFAQMERLTDENLNEQELLTEINRSREVTRLASQIVSNGQLILKAKMFYDERYDLDAELPKMLEG